MIGKRQITTMCPMNCLPTQCGMTVEVEQNKLVSLKGDPNNPDSRGFLSEASRHADEIFLLPPGTDAVRRMYRGVQLEYFPSPSLY